MKTTWRSKTDMAKTYHPKSKPYKLDDKLGFGKHYHRTVKQVLVLEPSYIYWMITKNYKFDPQVEKILTVL